MLPFPDLPRLLLPNGGVGIKLTQQIDLKALRHNVGILKSRYGAKLLAMVKADAYGHGMKKVAAFIQDAIDFFGVATVEEGVLLRDEGILKPVLVTVFSSDEADVAVKYGLSTAVFSIEQVIALEKAAQKLSKELGEKIFAKIHIKIDSGMNRLGIKDSNELDKILKAVKSCNFLKVEGIYSHLYNVNDEQYRTFGELSKLAKREFQDALTHISSSGAVLSFGADGYDMARVGIALYGYSGDGLLPVMSVKSKVVASKKVKKGEHIGYGDFKAMNDCNIAVVFGGYADGILRKPSGFVTIRDSKCRIITVACMDMTIVETVGFVAEVGEEAYFLSAEQNADELAEYRETISYEILTGFSRERCEKIYIE